MQHLRDVQYEQVTLQRRQRRRLIFVGRHATRHFEPASKIDDVVKNLEPWFSFVTTKGLPVEYSRDADGHEIGKYPWMRAIATWPVNRRDVISDRLLAVIVLVQSGDENLYICEATR